MQLSYFLYFGGGDVGVVLFHVLLGHFYEVAVALVVLGESVTIAVGAVAGLAPEAEEPYFFMAEEAPGVVLLPVGGRLWNGWYCEVLHLFLYAFLLPVLPGLGDCYLWQTEHMFRFWGLPKNLLQLTHSESDISSLFDNYN